MVIFFGKQLSLAATSNLVAAKASFKTFTCSGQTNLQTQELMFGLKSKKEKLEVKYATLLQEAYELSHTNRTKSDEKTAQADELRKQIDAME